LSQTTVAFNRQSDNIVATLIDPHTAATALGIANTAIGSVKSALELAKKTKDLELKHEISNVMDNVLDLKAKVLELDEENRNLRQRLEQKEAMKREGKYGYWFKEGETDPLCPKCYESTSKVIYLSRLQSYGGMTPQRNCKVCGFSNLEK
jgi:hypothetical protein